ncbi:hypothetical protein SNOG_10081 [Parastagonospora nodorum SN15]|uniref:Uncharacterized protein n=1 Tax=Phaeosphaeria nodorum (strain SN15 / ATCC MYA-4574 / FGSC 10173) TaxID=321614 RepID=Q0UDT3_PHANO|nr:hypothetical protein SNOG_10081 [Parastagonospora nodorum SN15]EAT82416.1 hypothetical protein SNOG_10081 [Parastagonospora nodorum SN15]
MFISTISAIPEYTNNTAPGPAIPLPTAASYHSTWCHYDLQLFQECRITPLGSYVIRTLGNIFAIRDERNNTITTYSEGMGMIDAPTSMERLVPGTDLWLSMQYGTDNTTYFGFGTSKWNDTRKETINTTGWCNPEPWTKKDMQCGVLSADYFRRVSATAKQSNVFVDGSSII